MGSKSIASVALLLSLILFLFSMASSHTHTYTSPPPPPTQECPPPPPPQEHPSPPPQEHPSPPPPSPPPPPAQEHSPPPPPPPQAQECREVGLCANVLSSGETNECCPVVRDLLEANATVCICAIARTVVVDIPVVDLNAQVVLLLNECGHNQTFSCDNN
ncbi:glyceraldehyde-3-phosphate dehydrogenase, testis-specific-like [Vigna unguiculata]|uniref:Hydrophobic seed protein n=1 Tax=Vigna unguiculata TaxID=3917 RepID=A0A4D6KLK2_VIGUN|nr:glyceraldehyde-3-phosphate dehydrogenase, testis-specific-like [Vigna unguiculata]QCD77303.1 Hydrophobic seed protein [Vigna unguiculata]